MRNENLSAAQDYFLPRNANKQTPHLCIFFLPFPCICFARGDATLQNVIIKDAAIFRSGDYGEKGVYTDADLKETAKFFNGGNAGHIPPVTVDHKQEGPAWGNVVPGSVYTKNGVLFADLEVLPEFAPAVRKGLYRQRSIELYRQRTPDGKPFPGNTIRAVTFLGAAPPEVKGLPDLNFKESEVETIIFEEGETMSPEEMLAKIAELEAENAALKAEKEAAEMADNDISESEIAAPAVPVPEPEMSDREKMLMKEIAALKAGRFSEGVDRDDKDAATAGVPANIRAAIKKARHAVYTGVTTFAEGGNLDSLLAGILKDKTIQIAGFTEKTIKAVSPVATQTQGEFLAKFNEENAGLVGPEYATKLQAAIAAATQKGEL